MEKHTLFIFCCEVGSPGFEPGTFASSRRYIENENPIKIDEKTLKEYLLKRELKGISKRHLKEIRLILQPYIDYSNYSLNKEKTLKYLFHLKEKYSVSRYRKEFYQIRKFLNYLGIDWLDDIEMPPEPEYKPKRVTREDIVKTIEYFSNHAYFTQLKALILLGATSGLRAEELYQLGLEDIDIDNRIVYVNHDPNNGKTTKTKKSRISFFNEEAKQALIEYMEFFNKSRLKQLFSKSHIERAFRNAPIRVKDLRKFFSQEWEKRNGSYAVKEIIMGHSLKGKVDLQHYAYLDTDDLKKIYDKIMPNYFITKNITNMVARLPFSHIKSK